MNRILVPAFGFILSLAIAVPAWAEASDASAAIIASTDDTALILFVGFVIVTLGITGWAASRTKTAADFYAAGGTLRGWQNGIAIAGDFMSAASFLGIAALVYTNGFDGLIYAVGFLVGWPIIMFLMAERLRNLGRFTFADVVSYRLRAGPVRTLAAIGTLVTVAFYLIAQMVGAGQLIALLFGQTLGLGYAAAVVIVGVLMMIYVTFGGMVATTWVQIIKACLLIAGATLMAFLVLRSVDFDINDLFVRAIASSPKHLGVMRPGSFVSSPVSTISLGMALMFGTAGLPHILMRFFTVQDARQARKSVLWATGLIGYFYILTFIIGFGAIVLVSKNPAYLDAKGALIGGANMPAIHLADALGGSALKGFISAVAFATILAVVSGLTLSGASAVSHDLYANVLRTARTDEKMEVYVSRITTIVLGLVAILLGIVFETVNVAFMVGLAFAIAASSNFPVLLLAMMWKGLTTRGAVMGGSIGLISAVLLTVLSPGIWVSVLGNPAGTAPFPYSSPAIFTIPLAFFCCWLFSITDRSAAAALERQAFEAQFIRSQTGIGAATASAH